MKSRTGVVRIENGNDASPSEASDGLPLLNDEATTLEELSMAYAKLLMEQAPTNNIESKASEDSAAEPSSVSSKEFDEPLDETDSSDQPIEARAVIEAMLFIGRPDNKPLSSEYLAGMMRGIEPADVAEIVSVMNERYKEGGLAIEIVTVDGGYRMQVSSALEGFRNRVSAKVRETQLNQSAIDCLSLVAYQPGTTREEIEKLWGRPAGGVLSLLVRRELLRIDRRVEGRSAHIHYFPTDRFLNLVGIASLDDLPMVDDEA